MTLIGSTKLDRLPLPYGVHSTYQAYQQPVCGCWSDVGATHKWACNKPPTTEIGLCAQHYKEMVGD